MLRLVLIVPSPCGILFLVWFGFEPLQEADQAIWENRPMEAAVRQNLPMILIRVIVGLVFLLEGALKFVRPEQLGVARFASIGLPFPQQLAPLVGGIEIGGGAAILLNFYAGDAALVLLIVICTALVTTKLPILFGRHIGPFAPAKLNEYGWLSFFHEARVDLCMLFGLAAVLIDSGVRVGRKRRWYQDGR
jgi:uncharacterized membrane protein YphA (DoxX/SURF4 family)